MKHLISKDFVGIEIFNWLIWKVKNEIKNGENEIKMTHFYPIEFQ